MKRLFCLLLLLSLTLYGCAGEPAPQPIILDRPTEPAAQMPTQAPTEAPAASTEPAEPTAPPLPQVTVLRDPELYRSVTDSCYHAAFALREDGVLLSKSLLDEDGTHLGREAADPYEWKPVLDNVASIHIPRDTFGMTEACFAVTNSGELWGWGAHMAFPDGESRLPVKVMDNVRQVAMDTRSGLLYVLDPEGTVWGCGVIGDSIDYPLTKPTKLVMNIASLQMGRGDDPSVLLLREDGRAFRLTGVKEGRVTHEALPYDAVQHYEDVLLTADGKVYDLSLSPDAPLLENCLQVSGGRGRYCAVTREGQLYAWDSPTDRMEGETAEPQWVADGCGWVLWCTDGNFVYLTGRGELYSALQGSPQETAFHLDRVLAARPFCLRTDGFLWQPTEPGQAGTDYEKTDIRLKGLS